MNKINPFSLANLSLILFFLLLSSTNKVLSQGDSTRLAQLIKETNDLFLYPFAQGVLLSPYELREHNRDRMIKNIGWVNTFTFYRQTSSKKDSIGTTFTVEDNQTLIQTSNKRYKSITYAYYEDGRIHKRFKDKRLDDLFLNDEDGFLIQHGFGGELKRAKRKDKIFKWYTVKKDQLEYVISYDDQNRISKMKTLGHYFGPGVDYQIEEYVWEAQRLVSKNAIMKYKAGGTDTTFMKLNYDSLGLIAAVDVRNDKETTWTSTLYETKIEPTENEHIIISIAHKGEAILSITFDHYDNMIEWTRPNNQLKKVINYRKRKRGKSLFKILGIQD